MTCLAYIARRRDGGLVEERWISHAEGTRQYVRRCTPYAPDILAERLDAEGHGIDEKDAELVIYLAAALHDLGKTLNAYQAQNQAVKNGKIDKASYYGHEAVSAYLIDVAMSEIWGSAESGDIRTILTAAAAAMHHHAMRSLADWWIRQIHPLQLADKLATTRTTPIRVGEECLNEVSRAAVLAGLSKGEAEKVAERLAELKWENAKQLVKQLITWYHSVARYMEKLPRAYLLVLGPLVIADNAAAATNRGGNIKPWQRELQC